MDLNLNFNFKIKLLLIGKVKSSDRELEGTTDVLGFFLFNCNFTHTLAIIDYLRSSTYDKRSISPLKCILFSRLYVCVLRSNCRQFLNKITIHFAFPGFCGSC